VAAKPARFEAAEVARQAVDLRIATVGMWLFIAANAFFYAAWYFAFFYLKALNNNGAWIMQGLTMPSKPYGTIVLVLALLSAGVYFLASRATASRALSWRLPAVVALILGMAAALLQIYEMWHLGFGLTEGGYPSVFSGLTGFWTVELGVAMFWLATILSQARIGGDTIVRPASTASFGHILYFLAAIGVLNWILLYFVA
jgi:heme/copper-type cytochrome/quinol oxidase subunit 3